MRSRVPAHLALFAAFVVTLLLSSSAASADDVAPELERADLRVRAQAELRRLLTRLPSSDQRRLVGTYIAFDPDAADPSAQIACDDDGDHVVVVTDAMLRLVGHLARGGGNDGQDRRIEDYAAFLARTQLPRRRLLAPPPGFFDPPPPEHEEDRVADVLSFVIARELVRLRAGDLVCPRPTATREAGDDVWTAAERIEAVAVATRLYPGDLAARDAEATARVLDAGRTDGGESALRRFFVELALVTPVALGQFAPTYARLHGRT